ncbi:hypothetical protein [Rufibacter hautae]|uniref:STAS/SEC14 domain-containing protein n=1 Tax=Rufibacter hautae TaxID=2595005 RepID=A0A5B6TPU6_9BACT|nr:hypothetical protein [Rufibacter hautae]KAA3438443.1 hypothetical protein FOA19_14505 [Rufibacter hautae]
MNELFKLISAEKLEKCLINTSSRGALSMEAEEWELSILQSEANPAVPQGMQVALVMSEERYQQMIHDYSLNKVCKINLPIHIHYFTQVEEAIDWLEHESTMPS